VTNRAGRGCAFAALVVATTLATSACDKAAAKTPGPAPEPLTVPMPPTRLVIPVSIEDPAENAAAAGGAGGDRAGGSAGRGSKPPTSGSGAAGSTTAGGAGGVPPPVPPNPPASDGGPPQVLRTAAAGELETRAKERLDRAVRDLGRVSRGSLGADARDQYDSADRFIRMAKDALASRNFVFALSCADKAATLAALLVK
jgi:hypothetical protein